MTVADGGEAAAGGREFFCCPLAAEDCFKIRIQQGTGGHCGIDEGEQNDERDARFHAVILRLRRKSDNAPTGVLPRRLLSV